MTDDHTRPPLKHPKGHCWNVVTRDLSPLSSIARLETPAQCRAWLAKLNEMGESAELKEAVAARYEEVTA